MKKEIMITPRRSGKSRLAVYEFIKDPKNSCIITFNEMAKSDLLSKYSELSPYKEKILTQNSKLQGKSFDICIIDEYFLFKKDKIKSLYDCIRLNEVKELYIFATLSKYIDKILFDFVYYCKYNSILPSDEKVVNFININKYLYADYESCFNEFNYYYYNWITDVDSSLTISFLQYNCGNPMLTIKA